MEKLEILELLEMQEMEDQKELHMSNFMIKILYLKLSLYQESNLWEIQ